MAQIKKFDTNWLDQAWRISSVIADMPDSLPMSLLSNTGKAPPLTDWQRNSIELLQDHIEVLLQYRSRLVHKIAAPLPDGSKTDIFPYDRNPVTTAKTLAYLVKRGAKLQGVDLWAYDAHMKLGRILIDRYVCREWKRQLPLIVASIGGEFTSRTATLNATQSQYRKRKENELKAGKEEALSRNANLNWKELLDDLQGDEIVTEWDLEKIHWLDAEGNRKTTATQTFKNWKRQKK